jgi:hypothetical protein
MNVIVHELPAIGACDFCAVKVDTGWSYPAKDCAAYYPDINFLFKSEGAWLACPECHKLIEADDRKGLAKRMYTVCGDDPNNDAPVVGHEMFYRNRTGAPIQYTGETIN